MTLSKVLLPLLLLPALLLQPLRVLAQNVPFGYMIDKNNNMIDLTYLSKQGQAIRIYRATEARRVAAKKDKELRMQGLEAQKPKT